MNVREVYLIVHLQEHKKIVLKLWITPPGACSSSLCGSASAFFKFSQENVVRSDSAMVDTRGIIGAYPCALLRPVPAVLLRLGGDLRVGSVAVDSPTTHLRQSSQGPQNKSIRASEGKCSNIPSVMREFSSGICGRLKGYQKPVSASIGRLQTGWE